MCHLKQEMLILSVKFCRKRREIALTTVFHVITLDWLFLSL